MADNVSFKIEGDLGLQRKFDAMEGKVQNKVVRPALRASAKRFKEDVIANLSGRTVQVRTGNLREAFQQTKVRALPRRRHTLGAGLPFPERSALNPPIDPKDKHFWPAAVEYGHDNVPPHSYLRAAVDEHYQRETGEIGADLGRGINREWKRK